jgi:hypothetical protein
MSEHPLVGRERLYELFAERAVFGLGVEEEQELQELLRLTPGVDAEEWDRLTTLLDGTSCAIDLPPLPPELAARVRSQAPNPVPTKPHGVFRAPFRKRELLAWLTAAACLLVAVYSWTTHKPDAPNSATSDDPGPIAKRDSVAEPAPPPVEPTLAQQRDELLASSEGVLQIRLPEAADPNDPHISGDIVWSPSQQRGFLRIKGLPSNDPAKSQYQLWLVETTPMRIETVNGGVFDVDQPSQQLIVPIRAEHFVQQPNMLVVSIEPPGGSTDLTVSGYPLVAKLDDAPW